MLSSDELYKQRIQELRINTDKLLADIKLKEAGGFPCLYCQNKFSNKNALGAHERKEHFEEYHNECMAERKKWVAEKKSNDERFIAELEQGIKKGKGYLVDIVEMRKEKNYEYNLEELRTQGSDVWQVYHHYYGKKCPPDKKDEAIQLLEKIRQIQKQIQTLNKDEFEERMKQERQKNQEYMEKLAKTSLNKEYIESGGHIKDMNERNLKREDSLKNNLYRPMMEWEFEKTIQDLIEKLK